MTIKELYEMAKARGKEDYKIILYATFDCGYSGAGGEAQEVTYFDNEQVVELANMDG